MSYALKGLGMFAYTNGRTLWNYQTDDSSGDILEDGYFDDARHLLHVGDIIIANTDSSDAVPSAVMLHVRAIDSDAVRTSPLVGTS